MVPANSAPQKRLALLSVFDKSGLAEFAEALVELGFELLSTGGTAAELSKAGLPDFEVSEHTGVPEIMGGRVKTLHPKIHGGILGRDSDADTLQEHGIDPIELVVVNLYPFERVVSEPDCSLEVAIENIDIGGPAMVRAAAKNHARVCVLTDPADYRLALAELRESGRIGADTRRALALKAFAHTARYDGLVADYLAGLDGGDNGTPAVHAPRFLRQQVLRYGENPHQAAGFYLDAGASGGPALEPLQGKPLSFNNLADADSALECVLQFASQPACVIVKHANPCGV
ncbi:MAG TPA: bifunctional phosphoribosylaminoimidazolecarboxamide formyltransferase/IMP cyclohydrolase, partial [Xanthomonadales bacterium]|nr:bifunctional phosphoribosylaminoimidazolecarboxamide formyltransferase/IMP cyclohydrolase [Xanthomonadales bacterium]